VLDDAAFGAATEVTPKYLVDLAHGSVVDVETTTAIRQAEVTAAKRRIERTMDRFDPYPARLAGDSAYGSAEMLRWLVYERGIEPHVTVFGQIRAPGRHVLTRGLRLRSRARRLCLPGGQDAGHTGDTG
jgi:hypothetical protein